MPHESAQIFKMPFWGILEPFLEQTYQRSKVRKCYFLQGNADRISIRAVNTSILYRFLHQNFSRFILNPFFCYHKSSPNNFINSIINFINSQNPYRFITLIKRKSPIYSRTNPRIQLDSTSFNMKR